MNKGKHLRIGIFTDTYYPEINGVANSSYLLKLGLEKQGHTVFVFTVTNPKIKENEKNVIRIKSIPFFKLKERRIGLPFVNIWIKRIKRLNLDIIHTQTEFSLGHLGRKVSKKLEIPLIHTYHTIYEDYAHYINFLGGSSYQLKSVIEEISRNCCNKANKVVVPTLKVKNLLLEYGVNKPIYIQPTGIDINKFQDIDEDRVSQLYKEHNLNKNDINLIYIGRISEEKNLMEIVNFMVEVSKECKNLKLIIVGDGPDRINIESQIKKLNLEESIIMLGARPWSEIQNYYALGNIFVCASKSETQGLTYLEAMASGKPILARKDECLNPILIEGRNGYSYNNEIEFIENIKKMIIDNKYIQMGENAKKVAYKFSRDTFAQNIERIYETLINEKEMEKTKERIANMHIAG